MMWTVVSLLICHLYILFSSVCSILCPFKNYVCFLFAAFEFFIYRGYKSFVGYLNCKHFFIGCGLLLKLLLIVYFAEKKCLVLIKSDIKIFPFMDPTFCVMSKNYLPMLLSRIFPMSSKTFTVLHFTP